MKAAIKDIKSTILCYEQEADICQENGKLKQARKFARLAKQLRNVIAILRLTSPKNARLKIDAAKALYGDSL